MKIYENYHIVLFIKKSGDWYYIVKDDSVKYPERISTPPDKIVRYLSKYHTKVEPKLEDMRGILK